VLACAISHTPYKFYVSDTGIQLSGFTIKFKGKGDVRPILSEEKRDKLALIQRLTSKCRYFKTFVFQHDNSGTSQYSRRTFSCAHLVYLYVVRHVFIVVE
jgi:hypothetical protein